VAASGMVFFSVLSGYQTGVLAGLESYKKLAQAIALGAIVNLMVCLMGAYAAGFDGVVIGLSLSALLQWFIYQQALLSETKKHGVSAIYKNISSEKSIFYRFALPAAISGFVSMPANWLANSFLIREANGVEQIALFTAVNSLRSIVLFMPVMFNKVTASLLNNQRGLNEGASYRSLFRINLYITCGIGVAGAGFVATLGPWLLGAFGKTFENGSSILYIMLLVTVMEVIFQALYQIIQSNERMWISFFAVVIPRDVLCVLLAIIFIPKWGAAGLSAAYVGSWLLALILVCLLSSRHGIIPKSQ
jgi:O-antigen/teichoic acid export membrane protein